jgi:excisionase family DNA binding protein
MDQQAQMRDAATPPIQTRGDQRHSGSTSTGLLLDIKEAAWLLNLTVWQVRGLVSAGELRVARVGRKFYFRKQSLVRWAERAEQ